MAKKVCLISCAGGHLEQIEQLQEIKEKYDHYYVITKHKSTEKLKKEVPVYLVGDFYRDKKIQFVFRFAYTAIQQLFIFLKERPDVVITTGAGIVIPTCLYAKFFKKKVVYIESFARMKSLNKTGEFLYKYADLFIVQWPDLMELCPNAVYGGWIY